MLHEVKGKLEDISNTEFQKMFNVILEDLMNVPKLVIYNKMDIQLENKNDVIEKAITRQLEEINQFSKDLKELNVLYNLKLFKDETIKKFIVSGNNLTSKMLQEISRK